MKGVIQMAKRLTWKEIQTQYPDQWVGIVDAEFSNPVTISAGIVKYTEQDMSRDEMILRAARGEMHAEYTTPDKYASVGALMA